MNNFFRFALSQGVCCVMIVALSGLSHASLPFTCKYTATVKKVAEKTIFDKVSKRFITKTALTLTKNHSTSERGVGICGHRVGSTLTVKLHASSKELAKQIAVNKVLKVSHYTSFRAIPNPKKGQKRYWTFSVWSIIP